MSSLQGPAQDPTPLKVGQCLLFGCVMKSGAALGLVTAIGDSTILGKIASECKEEDVEEEQLNGKPINQNELFSCCEELRLKEVGFFTAPAVATLARLAHKGGQD